MYSASKEGRERDKCYVRPLDVAISEQIWIE